MMQTEEPYKEAVSTEIGANKEQVQAEGQAKETKQAEVEIMGVKQTVVEAKKE